MTVPKDFRRSSDISGILILHYAGLPGSIYDGGSIPQGA